MGLWNSRPSRCGLSALPPACGVLSKVIDLGSNVIYKQGGGGLSKETVVLALRQSEAIRSDEWLTFETSAFNLFTVANLPYQLGS